MLGRLKGQKSHVYHGALLLLALASCAAPIRPGRARQATGAGIDTVAMRSYTRFLSDDRLRGRATATPGADTAAAYIARQCERLGLSPVEGRYLHPVPLIEATVRPDETALVVGRGTTDASRSVFSFPGDFFLDLGTGATLRSFDGRAVFVGGADDARAGTSDLTGLAAVTWGTVPPDVSAILAGRGAAGIVQLIPDDEQYIRYRQSRGVHRLYVDDPNLVPSMIPSVPTVTANITVARRLFQSAIRFVRDSTPQLTDSIRVSVGLDRRPVQSSNVVCVMRGSDDGRESSALAFTAHYDHLGVGGAVDGDSIYNGFSDNAAGVAMLLAIAQRMHMQPLRQSVLFLFLTGEERGLLGSDYLASRPPWPLDSITGVINLDAGAPPARPWSWRIAGGDASTLGRTAVDVALASGWSATTSNARPNSDYYPFWRRGIPSIFIVPGPEKYEGITADSSDALRQRWDRYHHPDDEWAEDFPFEGLMRYAEYAFRVARAWDNR